LLAEPGFRASITFKDGYSIERSKDCKYDSLTIQDGPFLFSPVIKKLCGSGVAGTTITTTGTYMRLVFYTDDVIEKTGFSLQFNESVPAICEFNCPQ